MTDIWDEMKPKGFFPNWDIDKVYGEEGEQYVYSVMREMLAGRVEVKTERYANGRLFIEVEQGHPHNPRPSGMYVTEAEYISYMKPGGIIVSFPTKVILDYIAQHEEELFVYGNGVKAILVDVGALMDAQPGRKNKYS